MKCQTLVGRLNTNKASGYLPVLQADINVMLFIELLTKNGACFSAEPAGVPRTH